MARLHVGTLLLMCTASCAGADAGPDAGSLVQRDADGRWSVDAGPGAARWPVGDYSFTGFRLGSGGPRRACRIFPVAADAPSFGAALQRAIDGAEAAGGGVVRIPAGTFTLRHPVAVAGDRVSVAGAGSSRTTIRVASSFGVTDQWSEGAFTFGKAIGGFGRGWLQHSEVRELLTRPVPAGARWIPMARPERYGSGEWLLLQQQLPDALMASHAPREGQWRSADASDYFTFSYLRRVERVADGRVLLDAPVPRRLDPEQAPVRVRKAAEPARARPTFDVGVSGLTLVFADQVPDESPRTGARPSGSGIVFEGVVDGWIHDVHVRNAPRFGVFLDGSARITVSDAEIAGAQDRGEGGYGYALHLFQSQNVLVRDTTVRDARHGVVIQGPAASMIALSGVRSQANRFGDDTHHALSHAILWDDYQLRDGTGLHLYYRGAKSDGAHETVGDTVVWNVRGDGIADGWLSDGIYLNPAHSGRAVVAGSPGEHAIYSGTRVGLGEAGNRIPGHRVPLQRGPQRDPFAEEPAPGSREANVLYTHLHRPAKPRSLFRAQARARLGRVPFAPRACPPAVANGERGDPQRMAR